MAEDWIKMRTGLYRDPKVSAMADYLLLPDGWLAGSVSQSMQRDMCVTRNVIRNMVVGSLVSVWGVARHQGKRIDDDLHLIADMNAIDDIADIPGFSEAMETVGWIVQHDETIVFPRFFAANNVDPTERKREKDRQRKARQRERDKSRDMSRDSHGTVTHRERVEKEKSKSKKEKGKKESPPDTWTIPIHVDSPDVRRLLDEFLEYRKRRKKPITRTYLSRTLKHYESPGHLAYAIEHAMGNGYQGIKTDYRPQTQNMNGARSSLAQGRL